MNDFYEILSKCPLFDGIKPLDLHSLITCLDGKTIDVSKDSPIFFEGSDCRRVLTSCPNSCDFHSLLLKNLLHEMAQKNLSLSQKIRYMSEKLTKDKLMAYLLDQAKHHQSTVFVIPFDRQALADYLGVERSAMSAEIGKLKKLLLYLKF